MYKNKVLNYLKKGGIPIIAGFQGINSDNRLTTLGEEDQMLLRLCVLDFLGHINVLFILM